MQDWLRLFLQLQDHSFAKRFCIYYHTEDIKSFVFYCFINSLKGLNMAVVWTCLGGDLLNRLVLCTFTKVRQCSSRKFGIVFLGDDRS